MALLPRLVADGVRLEALPGGKLRATGNLTDAARALIRANKAAILVELGAANDPTADPAATRTPLTATPAEVAELRQLIAIVLAGSPADEHREALAIACADVDAALQCFRLLAAATRGNQRAVSR